MAIAGSNFLFGIAMTASLVDAALQALGLPASAIDEFSGASVDSEFRFYSVFWFVYGVMLWRTAGRLGTSLPLAGLLIGLFGLGGIGRLLSYLSTAAPATLFLVLTWIEIVLTLVMAALWLRLVTRQEQQPLRSA